MSRFYFNIYGGADVQDRDGMDLASVDDARQNALRYASELLHSDAAKTRLGKEWRIEAADDRGMIVFRVALSVGGIGGGWL